MFQAKLQRWKRLAASLILLPGLTAVGAEVLYLLGPARAQERISAEKTELAVQTLQRARGAFNRGDYKTASDLAQAVKAMNVVGPTYWNDTPERILADVQRKTGGDRAPVGARSSGEDARVLIKRAREALDAGRVDSAFDLANQAEVNGHNVQWGLFEEKPEALLREIQRVKLRRDQQQADRMLGDARALYDKRATSDEQRAVNLDKARSLCVEAMQLHGPYTLYHFGDRPETLLKDIDTARSRIAVAPRPTGSDTAIRTTPKPDYRYPAPAVTGVNPRPSTNTPTPDFKTNNNVVIYSGPGAKDDPRAPEPKYDHVVHAPPMFPANDPPSNIDPYTPPTGDNILGGTVVSRPLYPKKLPAGQTATVPLPMPKADIVKQPLPEPPEQIAKPPMPEPPEQIAKPTMPEPMVMEEPLIPVELPRTKAPPPDATPTEDEVVRFIPPPAVELPKPELPKAPPLEAPPTDEDIAAAFPPPPVELPKAPAVVAKLHPLDEGADLTPPKLPANVVKAVTPDETPKVIPPLPEPPNLKPEAVRLMQQASAYQKNKQYVEAHKSLLSAQKLNAAFAADEQTPDGAMQSLMAAAQDHVNKLCRVAHETMVQKTPNQIAAAEQMLGEAELVASGLGLDRWPISSQRDTLGTIKRNLAKGVTKPPETIPEQITSAKPPMVIPEQITSAKPPMVIPEQITSAKPPETIPEQIKNAKLPLTAEPMTPVTDSSVEVLLTQPRIAITPPDPGLELLSQARLELNKNGQLDTARQIAYQVLNGEFACKKEAEDLLRTIEAEQTKQRELGAVRAYERGVESLQNKNYEQALNIFKLIDPTVLPETKRRALNDHVRNAERQLNKPSQLMQAGSTVEIEPVSPEKSGADSLLKQQEAMMELQFQKLRADGLQLEASATARFGKGETDAALQDLNGFIARVRSANLDPTKVALLVRPIESRIERLKILKHQQDFLTKEAKDLKNFRNQMSQEALNTSYKKGETARLMKDFHRLIDEGKLQEANKVVLMARELDPQDPAVTASVKMANLLLRKDQWDKGRAENELTTYEGIDEAMRLGVPATMREPYKLDKERFEIARKRPDLSGGIGTQRPRTEADKKLESSLNSKIVSLDFKGMPLDQAVTYLASYTGLNFYLDARALQNDGVALNTPITASLNNITLKSALDLVLMQANLRYVVAKEVIRVTTNKGARGELVRKTIPVADLVVPVQNYAPSTTSSLDAMLQHSMLNSRPSLPGMANTPFTPPMGLNNSGTPTGTASASGTLVNNPSGPQSSIHKRAAAGTIEESLIRLITSSVQPDTWEAMGGAGRIEYYPLGMALVINQTPDVIEEVSRLLESLRQLQDLEIAIEVRMITLAESFYERIGLDFAMNIKTNTRSAEPQLTSGIFSPAPFVNDNNLKGTMIGLQAPNIPTPDLDIPIRATSFPMAIPPFGGFPNAFGADGGLSLGLAFFNDIQVQMFLEAAQGDRRTNVMQAPKLTMFNGQSAQLQIQDQQFFMTGISVTSVSGQLVYTPNNQPFPLGVSMNMQPVVSGDRRFVRLNITQQMTNLSSATVPLFPVTTIVTPVFEGGSQGQPIPFTQYVQQPTFTQVNIETTVVVPDGGTVLLGGMKTLNEGRNEFGPPVLSKIPYVNRLFRNVGYGRDAQSLMLMVTPRIIINREEQERQTGVIDGAPGDGS